MDLRTILQKLYPPGSQGGQCAQFCHRLVEFANVGDTYQQKKKSVDSFGIPKRLLPAFQIGDVVITNDGVNWFGKGAGHAFFVADMDKDNLYAAESNFGLNEKIGYGRQVPKNSDKIYGVIRGKFKFETGLKFPVVLKTTFFMQYKKQWNSRVFGDFAERVKLASSGQVLIEPFPVYTDFKDWWYGNYSSDGNEFHKVVAREYYDEQVMPLRFADSQVIIWAINKEQWQGSTLSGRDEIGWYYPNSNPIKIVISCEENDFSPAAYGTKLFNDACMHELAHGLYALGRGDGMDFTHNRHFGLNGYPKDLDRIFCDIDLQRLTINL